ncbi:antirestriction protein ArdC [Aquamicrobium terrae]|uniref:Antirestriction protein ArdC n=1 Tax=Aquamicrobium terrae TaxID=1324945 RepID=A0ABV2N267_9HYPH
MTDRKSGSRADAYTRITERIVADLEKGVRRWVQPWSAGNAGGRVTTRCPTASNCQRSRS